LHIGDVGAAQRLQADKAKPAASAAGPAEAQKYATKGQHQPGDETEKALITIIGRGHSGTRAMSHTLSQSGAYMGDTLNKSDNLADFGVRYDRTDDQRLRRAISWKYQVEIVRATPKPKKWTTVRLEDFVLKQEQTLKKLQQFLGFPLVKIPVKPQVVGRWKTDRAGRHDFPFFAEDLKAYGYAELTSPKAAAAAAGDGQALYRSSGSARASRVSPSRRRATSRAVG